MTTPIRHNKRPDGAGARTGSSFGLSVTVHVAVLFLLTLGVTKPPGPEEELVEIAYIRARYGDDVADKVEVKKPGPKPAGVASRSAQKSKGPQKPKPVPRPMTIDPRSAANRAADLADASTKPLAPARPKVPKQVVNRTQLQNREASANLKLDRPRRADASVLTDVTAGTPAPTRSGSRTDFKVETKKLVSRSDVIDEGAFDPTASAPSTGALDEVADSSLPSGGSLRSQTAPRATGPSGGVLESRSRSQGEMVDADDVASGGYSTESSGRRTILDYGSGGGGTGGTGGGLQARERPAPTRNVLDDVKREEPDGDIEEQTVAIGGDGVSLSLSGPISNRAIIRAVPPVYPSDAQANGWQGAVSVHFTVLADGTVKDNMYIEQAAAHHVLNEAAMEALRKWIFSSLSAEEAQVEQWGVLTIIFKLQ